MKFPRNAKIFRGQLDAAPFIGVFFLLVIFLVLASLVYTPGVEMKIRLPETSAEPPGVAGPTLAVAVTSGGQLFYENQLIQKKELQARLREASRSSPEPVTLVIQADKTITLETLLELRQLAADAGIKTIAPEVLPRVFDRPRAGSSPP
jgi:biopolymer transport protein ExbD